MNPFNKRTVLSALTLLLIVAPMSAYTPSANVEAGHRISGQDFSTDEAYLTTVLTTPVVLTVLGFLSLVILNIALCCRKCFKCCRCEPNDHHAEKGHDHDSLSKRMSYINHQKLMVFIVEMVLCGCVMLADMFCFYGYTGIVAGGEDLNVALDLINQLLKGALDGAKAIKVTTFSMTLLTDRSENITCPPAGPGASGLTAAYGGLKTLIGVTSTAMDAVVNAMGPIQENVATNKNFINDTLIAYADVFVFLVFSFAFVSVCLFVIFRLFRSTCGTKIAIAWGMLTFIILLLVCLPFMIFSSVFGDFCMAPSENAVMNAPAEIQEKLRFYSTCAAGLEDVVGDNLRLGKDKLGEILSTITTQMLGYCDGSSSTRSRVELDKIDGLSTLLMQNLDKIISAASCVKVQEIWFKIVNDALCTNFYSGIYSLWVSQFVTSFFLFLLIVQASISYHYFANSSVYVSTEGAIELTEKGSNPSDVKENLAEEMQKTNDYGDSEA